MTNDSYVQMQVVFETKLIAEKNPGLSFDQVKKLAYKSVWQKNLKETNEILIKYWQIPDEVKTNLLAMESALDDIDRILDQE